MRKRALFLCAFALALFASTSAFGDTLFNFSFSGPVLSGSGTLTGQLNSPGIYTITAATGSTSYGSNTYAITAVLPPGALGGNDNFLYFPPVSGGFLNLNGLSYSLSDGSEVNIYYIDGEYDEALIHNHSVYYDFVPIKFTPPVPEPESLILLGTGLVGAIGLIRRRIRT